MKRFTNKQECLDWLVENFDSYSDAIDAFNDKLWTGPITLLQFDRLFKNKHVDLDSKQQLEQRVAESFGRNVEFSGEQVKLRVEPSCFEIVETDENPNKYIRNLKGVECDVYDVLKAFDVTCPALQHLIKKALCAGLRGHKDKSQDLKDILDSAKRAIELNNAEMG